MRLTRESAVFFAISFVLASTMTRIKDSVPEARTNTRPSPFKVNSASFTASASSWESMIFSFMPPLWGTSTLIRTWGYAAQTEASSDAFFPDWARTWRN